MTCEEEEEATEADKEFVYKLAKDIYCVFLLSTYIFEDGKEKEKSGEASEVS